MGEAGDFGEQTLVSNDRSVDEQRLRLVLMLLSGGVLEVDLARHGDYTVGRSPKAEVQVAASSISRAHALLSVGGDNISVRDLRSTNGTFVNGRRLAPDEVAQVRVGDAMRFGDIVAQVRGAAHSRILAPRVLGADEFDRAVAEEAARCLQYGRSVTVLATELSDPDAAPIARAVVHAAVQGLDVFTERAPGRLDAMLVECDRDEAVRRGEQLAAAFKMRNVRARVGVAAFPGDVPSADSLLLASQLALKAADEGGVSAAREGARVLEIGGRAIVVAEPAMARLYAMIDRVAGSDMPVLVQGETGSGKEIIAEAVHVKGNRAHGPLVKLNCAAVPENLIDSELFGYEKGAFSGAERSKAGLYESAHNGTLFLDEIGEMPAALQAKLLRVLEDGRVRRLGTTTDRKVDVRVVAASHVDLRAAAKAGRFRQDLYYRLGAVVLKVPPLRERRREIPFLVERFLASADQAGAPVEITAQAMTIICSYSWPGNVRELKNIVQAAAVMCGGSHIDVPHLPPEIVASVGGVPLMSSVILADSSDTGQHQLAPCDDEDVEDEVSFRPLEEEIRELERNRMMAALSAAENNQTQAAKLIGMPLRTFQAKLKQYDLKPAAARRRRR